MSYGALHNGEPPACPFCRSVRGCECNRSLLAEGKDVVDALYVGQIRTARLAAMCGHLNCARDDCAGIVFESTVCENGHRQPEVAREPWRLATADVKHLVDFHRRYGRGDA